MSAIYRMSSQNRQILNWVVTIGSVLICALVLPTRIPGMELLGISPNWLLIWVVTWSIRQKRTLLQAAAAGLALGFLQDAMTAPHPSHALSLVSVAILTVCLQRLWLLPSDIVERDPVPVSLMVFGMAFVAETITAFQFSWLGDRSITEIWIYHQRVALCSAILSSLWAPVVYFPLNRWWRMAKNWE